MRQDESGFLCDEVRDALDGVGQKDVVIPFKELKASTRDGKDWLVLNRTKDELKRAPAVNNTGSPSEYRGQGGDVR